MLSCTFSKKVYLNFLSILSKLNQKLILNLFFPNIYIYTYISWSRIGTFKTNIHQYSTLLAQLHSTPSVIFAIEGRHRGCFSIKGMGIRELRVEWIVEQCTTCFVLAEHAGRFVVLFRVHGCARSKCVIEILPPRQTGHKYRGGSWMSARVSRRIGGFTMVNEWARLRSHDRSMLQQQQQQQQQPQRSASRLFSNFEAAGIPSFLATEGYNISPPLSNHYICLRSCA